jgi:hypothetical protein
MDEYWDKCLTRDGHTLDEYLSWNPERKEVYSGEVCNSFPLDQLTKEQADEGVALGYLLRQPLH